MATSDVKVWLNTRSGVYHCPGTRWYGNTKQGEYMTEKEAQDKGFRPDHGRPCQAREAPRTPTSASPQTKTEAPGAQAQDGNPNVKVWVNTSSGVYHCPGTRWYGSTKSGAYMTQKQAQAKGDRPAYGKPCQ